MSGRSGDVRARAVPWLLGLSLLVVLAIATVGSFGAGFGVMTACTNQFSCTVTACAPCRTTNGWLTGGWIAQGVLLLTGVALAVLAARRVAQRAVRIGALVLAPASFALFALTTWIAVRSF